MVYEILNGGSRAILAFMVVSAVIAIYAVAVYRNNTSVVERMTQTLVSTVAIIITFYFVSESNGST